MTSQFDKANTLINKTLRNLEIKPIGDIIPALKVSVSGDNIYLQLRASVNGSEQPGRKWYLSPYVTRNEIIQTALRAWLDWLEHEGRECFTYRGQPVASPHFDYDNLVDKMDTREVGFDTRLDLRVIT